MDVRRVKLYERGGGFTGDEGIYNIVEFIRTGLVYEPGRCSGVRRRGGRHIA